MKSYHASSGIAQLARESLALAVLAFRFNAPALARELIRRRDIALERVRTAYGVEWTGLSLLDIGSGQACPWSLAFAERNVVSAVDQDVVPHGADVRAYATILRECGVRRTLKTFLRKGVGMDRRLRRAMEKLTGADLAWPQTYRMDCQRLDFADGSFDGLFSFSTLEHVADPLRALQEAKRVLKRGGVAYISLELYTSINGAHDPRLWGDAHRLPLWAHLRRSCAPKSTPNVYVNMLRIQDFIELASRVFGTVTFHRDERGSRRYLAELSPAERSELSAYSDEELATQDFVILAQRQA
jgi:SAM-dependent methyltransferase